MRSILFIAEFLNFDAVSLKFVYFKISAIFLKFAFEPDQLKLRGSPSPKPSGRADKFISQSPLLRHFALKNKRLTVRSAQQTDAYLSESCGLIISIVAVSRQYCFASGFNMAQSAQISALLAASRRTACRDKSAWTCCIADANKFIDPSVF